MPPPPTQSRGAQRPSRWSRLGGKRSTVALEEIGMEFPANLRYTKEHEWARQEGNRIVVGITDYAQKELGDVVFVELPEVGTPIETMGTFGVVESVKAVSDLYAPVSGTIIEANIILEDQPELVNASPYGQGWMVVIEVANTDELQQLLTAAEYQAYVAQEKSSR